jgi:RNA polymerase sigma-70 factor (sigma-E family)
MARHDEEFAEFARESSARLQHVAFLLTGNRHDAEDAAQTALVRTYASWSRVRDRDAFAYTRTVLVNLTIDSWRRRYREYATEDVPDWPARTDVADDIAQRQWLILALGRLSPRERAVVVLRHYLDLPEAEVAGELNLPLGTVKSLNSRALVKLRIDAGSSANSEEEQTNKGAHR